MTDFLVGLTIPYFILFVLFVLAVSTFVWGLLIAQTHPKYYHLLKVLSLIVTALSIVVFAFEKKATESEKDLEAARIAEISKFGAIDIWVSDKLDSYCGVFEIDRLEQDGAVQRAADERIFCGILNEFSLATAEFRNDRDNFRRLESLNPTRFADLIDQSFTADLTDMKALTVELEAKVEAHQSANKLFKDDDKFTRWLLPFALFFAIASGVQLALEFEGWFTKKFKRSKSTKEGLPSEPENGEPTSSGEIDAKH